MTTVTSALRPYLDGADEERLPQRAYLTIRQAIRDLRFAPEQMVLEQHVAEALSMSRTPVREALIRLEAEGLVQLVPRHGFAVAPLFPDALQEIYEIMEGLEGMAVELATIRASDQDLASLDSFGAKEQTALDSNELGTWVEIDDYFHNRLIELSTNVRLRRLVENYQVHLHRARLFTIQLRPKPMPSLVEHQDIVAAMRARDPGKARDLIQAHGHRARDEILQVIRAITSTREI